MTITDSMALAAEAGLHYVSEGSAGFRRVRRGKGFSYVDGDGGTVDESTREWIRSLAIPPAWQGVWISADATGHILATGMDAAGRKQYVYHPAWEQLRDEVKFDRMAEFGLRIAGLRRRLDGDLRQPGLSRQKVTALAVSVLDRTLIRVGNRRYADDNEAYGLTTLTTGHVTVDGIEVQFGYSGKGGGDQQHVFRDRRLAGLIARCQELDGQTLLSYPGPDGVGMVSSTDVNAYLAETMRGPFTAKDFRTWGATVIVAGRLAVAGGDPDDALLEAIDHAAERLGNTRDVCRGSYLHPLVPASFRDGSLQAVWRRSRSGAWLARPESAVNKLMAGERG